MSIDKILKDFSQINTQRNKCKKDCDESITGLTNELKASIKSSLQNKSRQEYSEYFSQVFDMWATHEETFPNINITPFDEEALDEKYKKYTSVVSNKVKKKSTKPTEPTEVANDTQKLNKPILEYMLLRIWPNIFKESYKLLNSKISIAEIKTTANNWLLYELINQISKTISNMRDTSKNEVKLSSLNSDDIIDLIANTDDICKYILDSCMLAFSKKSSPKIAWFPKLNINKNLQVSNILAKSILVSFMFQHRQMGTIARNIYLSDINTCITDIYVELTNNNFLYNAIETYMKDENPDETIGMYKNQLISPRIIFIFVISVIQEVIKKALTQSKHNIFYVTKDSKNVSGLTKRDTGLREKDITSEIEKAIEGYKSIYYYFDTPTLETSKKKVKKLNEWIKELNKFRYGVLDDYLFELYRAGEISFEEITTTKTTLSKTIT